MKKRSFRSTFVSVILVITVAISIVNLAVYGINIKKIRQVEVLKMKTAGERIDDMITISLNNIKGLKQICCTDNYARNILLKNNEKNDIGTKFENQNYMDNALKHIASMDTLILRATIVNKYGNIYCTDTSIPEEYVKTIRNMTKEWMLFEGKEDEYYYGGLQGDNANILTFLYPLHTYGNTPIALLAVDINYKRDTQCGMFAATKVLQRYGLKYSYIYNCTTKSEEFLKGYETFIRTAAVLKSLRTLRIAKIGERPVPFMSVMTNEANLIKRFGITTVPISPVEICNRARKILEEKGKEYIKYEEEFVRKFPDGENYQQICATKLAVQELMEENNCSVAAFECWSAFPTLMGLCPCVVLGEMADNGMPLSCETDINGAITLAILRACNLFEESEFLADLTIRHPQNDNAELLWHCGPFPYSLKKDGVEAKLVDGQERFELKQGDLTVCRFDDVDGEYYLFAGEAKTTTGPETNGTYVWMETDNWKRWEEKLMFGPYIHHLGCVYGHYLPVLREVSRYLGIHFDNAHEQGIYSL